jgi:hypothetical protein
MIPQIFQIDYADCPRRDPIGEIGFKESAESSYAHFAKVQFLSWRIPTYTHAPAPLPVVRVYKYTAITLGEQGD